MCCIAAVRRLAAALILLLLTAGLAGNATARSVLDLDTAHQPARLLDWGDYWIDESGQASAETVAAARELPWQPTREGGVYLLGSRKVLWIRFTIPPAPDAERWYLEVALPAVDLVSLYTQDGAGKWVGQSAGDKLPVADWPVPHRYPVLPVLVSAEEPRAYLLRIQTPRAFGASLEFVSESYLGAHEQRTALVLGIYFGLAGLAGVVALLIGVSLRDGAYGLYALTVFMMAMSQAAMTGIGGLHLWPHWAGWNDLSPIVSSVLTLGTLLWFFSITASLPERSARLHRLLAGTGLLAIPIAAAAVLVDPTHRLTLLLPYLAIANLVGVPAVGWAASRGDRYALWLLGCIVPVMLGAAFQLARVAGWLPATFLTMHGLQVGIAIALPIMLVILMMRSQQRRENRRRIQGLDRIDPATGLINEQVFTKRLSHMMARSRRLKHQSAVLVIEIANRSQIRRDFGARVADELPLRVAGRLLSAAREIDGVARLSELRFGMLVEGPLTPEEAAGAGPRIVARCLMPFMNLPLEFVAQVRVAQTVVPVEPVDAQQVLERLYTLLANVPADTKRAVFTLGN